MPLLLLRAPPLASLAAALAALLCAHAAPVNVTSLDRVSAISFLGAGAIPPAPDVSTYDVSWATPSEHVPGGHYTDGMPLGNGATVVLAWANTTAGGLSFYVRHPHAQHTDSTDFTLSRVTVGLSPNPFLTTSYFNQTHHLEDGSITILAGGSGVSSPAAVLRIYVDANSDTVIVTAAAGDGATPYSLAVLVDSVRPTHQNYTQEFYCFQSSYKPDLAGPLDLGAPPGSIAIRHENCVACGDPDLFAFSVNQQGLAPALPSPLPASPLDGRVFGVGAFGGAGADGSGAPLVRNTGGTALSSAAPAPAFVVHLCVRVENEAPAQWEAGLATQLAAAATVPPTLRAAASAAWWTAFWGRSWITLPGFFEGSNESQVAPQYARTRFIQAAQSRGVSVPIKFNGMLYTTTGGSKGPLDVDSRDWGPDNCLYQRNLLRWETSYELHPTPALSRAQGGRTRACHTAQCLLRATTTRWPWCLTGRPPSSLWHLRGHGFCCRA